MCNPLIKTFAIAVCLLFSQVGLCPAQDETLFPVNDSHIVYHDVRVDAVGSILPWYCDDPSQAYDHDIRLVWNFWIHMRKGPDAVPYYLLHQVWKAEGRLQGAWWRPDQYGPRLLESTLRLPWRSCGPR